MIDYLLLLLLLAGCGVASLVFAVLVSVAIWRIDRVAVRVLASPEPARQKPAPYTDEQLLDAIREHKAIAIGRQLDPYGTELRSATAAEAAGFAVRAANDPAWGKRPCRPCALLKRVFTRSRKGSKQEAATTAMNGKG